MEFRERLLIGLVGLAVAAAGVQGILGYVSFRTALERDRTADLERYATLVASTLDVRGEVPVPIAERLPVLAEANGRFRVLRGDTVVLEGGGRFPEDAGGWLRTSKPLDARITLEAALDTREVTAAQREYLRSTLIALGADVLLGIVLALLLRSQLLRPLARLEAATEAIAHERFPEPLDVERQDEFGRLARSFNAMARNVRRALERERSFTRYVSHELRTPVANLKATSDAVRHGALDGSELLPVTERNAQRLERTLDGLLALARAHGPIDSVDLAALVAATVQALPAETQGRIRVRADPATVRAPRIALEGAVRNLLDNALRYSAGPVRIDCGPDGVEDAVRVAVADEGPGVPEHALGQLATPFRRLAGGADGIGLGLAYARQVAEGVGGRLELRNRELRGFEAALVLPKGG
ncbi:MAG: HAMP domain-containing sensor histidine kinase [Deinococcales bacterium]